MPSFDTYVFDVGGVLIRHDNEALFRRLATACAARDAVAEIKSRTADPRIGTGELAVEALHAALCRELGYRRNWDEFRIDWSSHFTIDADMMALARDLSTTRRVLLFSNTNAAHWQSLLTMSSGALGHFEAYLSCELGQAKPDLDAFRTVAARAQIEPARSLFIDDLAENVAAAREVGFHGHVFTDRATLARFLNRDAS